MNVCFFPPFPVVELKFGKLENEAGNPAAGIGMLVTESWSCSFPKIPPPKLGSVVEAEEEPNWEEEETPLLNNAAN